MEPKNYLKRNSKSAKINQSYQVPSKIRKTTVNLNILTKKQLIDKITVLNEELESLKNRFKTAEGAHIDNNTVTIITTSTQTLLKNEEVPYPCKMCTYNADNPLDLDVHMEYAHEDDDDGAHIPEITCNVCNNTFQSKNKLMEHIKISHRSSVPACKYFQNDTCKYNEKSCWFVHDKVDISAHKCRYCEYKCAYRSEIMKHQKTSHADKHQICKYNVKNKCKFREKCWYKHKVIAKIKLIKYRRRK